MLEKKSSMSHYLIEKSIKPPKPPVLFIQRPCIIILLVSKNTSLALNNMSPKHYTLIEV